MPNDEDLTLCKQVDCMQCKTSEANASQFDSFYLFPPLPLVETISSAVAVLAASQFLPIGM